MLLASGGPVDHVLEHLAPHKGRLWELETNTHFVMSCLASVLVVLVFVGLARRMRARGTAAPQGALDNLLESFVLFIRDEVVKPNMGPHAEHYAPFLLTVFFFVLVSNLMGLVPGVAAGTSNISVTAGLALVTFGYGAVHGVRQQGLGHYVKNLAPAGVPGFVLVILYPIEVLGLVLKHLILAVRLFFNMWAGHLVMGIILALPVLMQIPAVAAPAYAMVAAITFLELFVAFLQAYVFTMLASLFIGAQVHPEH